jgi:16S rRNA (guanine527-N7)-methyltransferase
MIKPVHDAFELLNRYGNVSRETFERLESYHALLVKWQKAVNLVGPDTLPDAWRRHFLDSLQLIPLLPQDKPITLMDMGTGAGFPGLVLAIATGFTVHLVESDAKKVSFLREVSRVTNAPVVIHHSRIEAVEFEDKTPDVILSRACSSLANLLSLAGKNVSRETYCCFHKGKNYGMEIDEARNAWVFDVSITPSIVDPQGVLLSLSNICRRGSIDEAEHIRT